MGGNSVVEIAYWYTALFLALLLVMSCSYPGEVDAGSINVAVRRRPCDEIYVVEEGETLQSIIEKCMDPYIVEENPHIHDPDDVFPGLVIMVTPFKGGS